ncbi:Monocarboxylate transporter 12-B [Frankliniella fusca]|uniref:Monocarboxylate transporter 12-B n=1 Tax=Frankliniella fusca TaxID=407009 RepID=A0AAE1I2L2_9NEOP|nr:Monocarboxylate transporter 12-B [Frankliniella fusca]
MTAAARGSVRKSGGPDAQDGGHDGAGEAGQAHAAHAKEAPLMRPPDGGWGWMVVVGVGIVNLATRSLEPSFGLLFADLLKRLEVATTGAAIIVSAQDALINFSGLFAGPLIRRYSYRKVAFFGALLVAIGILATVPANSVAHIIATYSVLIGLGVGFSSAATFVSLSHYFQARRGQAVGLSMAGTALGFMLAPLLVRYLLDELGFRGALLVLGGVALNGLAGAFLLQPAKWHLVPVQPSDLLQHQDVHLDLEDHGDEQDEPPIMIRESAIPLLARPRIELTLVEEDEEAYQLTIRAQNNERKTSTVSTGGGLAFEIFSDPKRKFSVTAAPNDMSKASLEDSEPHLYHPCRKLSQPAMPRNASVLSMEDHGPKRVPTARHGLPRNTSVVSMSVADGAVTSERKLSRTHYGIPRNVSWLSMGPEETTGRKLSRAGMPGMTRAVSSTRIRKASVISASSMDLTGSLMAIAAASTQDIYRSMQNNNTIIGSHDNINDKDVDTHISCWKRISNFLDLDLLKDSTYLNITLGLSLFWVAELHFKMVVPFFLTDMGHTKADAALCLSMSAFSDILARLILPPICDRVKYKKRTLFFVACIFLTISRSVMAQQTSWAPLMASLVICGFCRGATLINYQLTVAECVTLDKLPAAVGLNMVAKGITVVSLGPILGLIRDATGSYPIFIHAQSVLMALGLLAWIVEYVFLWCKRSSKRQSERMEG